MQHPCTDIEFRESLVDISEAIERFMLQHYDESEQTEPEERIACDEWMEDLHDLKRLLNIEQTPTPLGYEGTESSPVSAITSKFTLLKTVFGSVQPYYTSDGSDPGEAATIAKVLLASVAKAGYRILLKHYNRVSTVGVLACAFDPRFNLRYYEENGHELYIRDEYIPLYVSIIFFIDFILFIDYYVHIF